MKISEIGETGLIRKIRNRMIFDNQSVILGIGDDACALEFPPGSLVLATTDMLLESVHFNLSTANPIDIGLKAMAANISDIAAMGGIPMYCLIALAMPRETEVKFVDDFFTGLKRMGDKYNVKVVGGDTCFSPQGFIVNLTLLGYCERERILTRSEAKPGDTIAVSGNLGLSAAGLEVLKRKLDKSKNHQIPEKFIKNAVEAHLHPEPRVTLGRFLSGSGIVHSAIDISDGLATDLNHICEESHAGARIWIDLLPINEATQKIAAAAGVNPLKFACSGGEDYELLITFEGDSKGKEIIENIAVDSGINISIIGEIVNEQEGISFLDKEGRKIEVEMGFNHFKG